MALMYPRELDPAEVKSKAELRMFELIRDQLPDEWVAYHSVSWMIRDPGEGAEDGEIDFVLCHPEEGIVCLEVKGGGLECQHGKWHRTVNGKREGMADPFTQALDHRYDLSRKIDEVDGWHGRDLFLVHALAFPDIPVHKLVLAPDAPPEIVLDMHAIKDLEPAFDRTLDYHRGAREKRRSPGEDGAEMLRNLLAPEILIEVPMAAAFLDEYADLIRLTHEQAALLARFGRTPRMLVTGCAGSGKTMLAVEQAKRRARDGDDVVFVCFNRALRDHLAKTEKDCGVDFFTFHGLCVRLAKIAKVEIADYPQDETPPTFWTEELPLALEEAIEELGPQYDAIFVDEAQDLNRNYLDALLATLRDPEKGQVWLFMDDNQRVYESDFEPPPEFHRFDLTVNCRNTQAIHREVLKKYEGEVEPEVIGPPGRDLEFFESDDQAATVGQLVQRLCDKDEVLPQDIVVLSSHGYDNSAVSRTKAGRYDFVKDPQTIGPHVRLSSIRGFKGLESPVIVLCELEDLDEMTHDQQLYVGISRARNHCIVVAPKR